MFFLNKYKNEIKKLTQENIQLRNENKDLKNEVINVNQHSKQITDEISATAKLKGNNSEVNKHCLESSELLDQIRVSLAQSTSNLIENRDEFNTSQSLFDDIVSLLQKTLKSTNQITQDTQEASNSVDELKAVITGINEFVNIIKGISDQTNLLALNAAIEAARAGEQGRGFAVVADEVRSLAQRSADSSNEISNLIDKVNHQMGGVISSIEEVGKKSTTINDNTSSISDTANSIVDLSKRMYGVVTQSTADTFLQTVKIDHVVWKFDVYKVLLGLSDKPIEDFADHTMCRLGQWYYEGEGASKYTSHSAFQQIEKPHSEVHNHGLNALKAHMNNEFKVVVKELSLMEKSSFEVVNKLVDLSSQIDNDNK